MLNNEEVEILKIFAKYNPFSYDEIEHIYKELRSYDMLLVAMQMSMAFNESLYKIGMLIKMIGGE